MMTATSKVVAGLVVLLSGACAGAQTRGGRPPDSSIVEAVDSCAGHGSEAGPVVVLGDSWRSGDIDHFVILTRTGNRPVAFEYLVPLVGAGPATLVTYDQGRGAAFKVMAAGSSWRIVGEPSSSAPCAIGPGTSVGARDDR